MTIRTIITRGYGAGASIPAVILRGYFPEPSTADTHDGGYYPSRREIEEVRRRLRQAERAREEDIAQRREAERRLEAALDRAFRQANGEPEPEVAAIIAAVAPEAAGEAVQTRQAGEAPRLPELDFGLLAADLAAVARLLAEIERRWAEEDEEIAILMLAVA